MLETEAVESAGVELQHPLNCIGGHSLAGVLHVLFGNGWNGTGLVLP